jgi:hypothetical protein
MFRKTAGTSKSTAFATTKENLAYHVVCGSLSSSTFRVNWQSGRLPNSDFEYIHFPSAFAGPNRTDELTRKNGRLHSRNIVLLVGDAYHCFAIR